MFPENSRYRDIEKTEIKRPDGKIVAYLRRRFVPPAELFELVEEHTVTEGDRLDNVTATRLGDPELFWRIADANNAIKPDELTATIGRKLRITLPEGIPGAPNA